MKIKTMLKTLACVISTVVYSQVAQADVLEQNCLQLNAQCSYVALQKRDMAKLYQLSNAQFQEDLKKNKKVVQQMMDTVPTKDPLAVEVPLLSENGQSQNQESSQKIFFYRYENFVIRFRVAYESNQANAKMRGFWVMKIDPETEQ
ncbi:hypothetical protein RFI36_12190 [Acinetobacter gerneri]|uniref:Secreted protein n=1 Tax=Acinetobacter gerneri TaxID=202952 RepID=A0AAW8JII0_9GAMM|nr:hypothetical protein [Acinetobacter gerneri]MDQ9010393.1 hypothetical protein [Acinetobacter gerneri]MDQ9014592.1 hypothetical protein [Acinetobacter gerneri]MDQ9025763.1 hypothetical protein [Acinetobacter gerneri]MDQ9053044.1 hypothetical protein [Acinetobacter gerneri]MDQ9060662.1 hypothetical protein [Acinetobacter gerneri]